MDYIYGKLNKLVEAQKYNINSSDKTLSIASAGNNVDLNVNTSQLITLKQVVKGRNPEEDPIKYYSLYAYNNVTKNFDIKIGEELKLDFSFADDAANAVKTAWVKIGEYQKTIPIFDENGFPVIDPITGQQQVELVWETDDSGNLILDAQGNPIPVMLPKLQQITTSVNAPGQLILSQIPASAIVDTKVIVDPETGAVREEQIESILDGNAGGEVY